MTLGDIGTALDTAAYLVVVPWATILLVRLIRNGIKSVASAEGGRTPFLFAIAYNSYGILTYWSEGSYVRFVLAMLTVTVLSAYVYVVNWQIDKLKGAVE